MKGTDTQVEIDEMGSRELRSEHPVVVTEQLRQFVLEAVVGSRGYGGAGESTVNRPDAQPPLVSRCHNVTFPDDSRDRVKPIADPALQDDRSPHIGEPL